MNNTDNTETFDKALSRFVENAQGIIDTYYKEHFGLEKGPVLSCEHGRRFVRVVRTDNNSISVFCFIDKETGNVLKAASWKKPAAGKRGTIYSFSAKDYGVNAYGANYLR